MWALLAYFALTKLWAFSESKESVYFSLYIGFLAGLFCWLFYHFELGNADYDALQLMLQPFVLVVTIWGYVMDRFGAHKDCAIAFAAFVLAIPFLISLKAYRKGQEKKAVDVVIEKTSTVYDVVLTDGRGIESHYKITIKRR